MDVPLDPVPPGDPADPPAPLELPPPAPPPAPGVAAAEEEDPPPPPPIMVTLTQETVEGMDMFPDPLVFSTTVNASVVP